MGPLHVMLGLLCYFTVGMGVAVLYAVADIQDQPEHWPVDQEFLAVVVMLWPWFVFMWVGAWMATGLGKLVHGVARVALRCWRSW